ncbi:unnamed protein product [Medioppia subpectinata]|uniref:Peptidase S1 domain-containing protein n=1 Tax=Medioppia subpectinata TaxID=1979941 RepID=A0A7R9KXE7_9ACAR|nr:unnamed protein product [Medioppia subpectinata]CAG2111394.1 unnamed protein product [Medioppia subpectinata]
MDPYITTRACAGAVINQWWIITAGHCVNCNASKYTCPFTFNIRVGVVDSDSTRGHNCGAARVYPHPEYKPAEWEVKPDIALIRVNTSIPFTDRLAITNVCLPARGLVNTGSEYAVTTGWGVTGEGRLSPRIRQMGWVRIVATDPNLWPTNHTELIFGHITPLTSGTAICAVQIEDCFLKISRQLVTGDSGGPLVQYVSGRAVLIGVTAGPFYFNRSLYNNDCAVNYPHSVMGWTRVSIYIDWIIGVINNETHSGR